MYIVTVYHRFDPTTVPHDHFAARVENETFQPIRELLAEFYPTDKFTYVCQQDGKSVPLYVSCDDRKACGATHPMHLRSDLT